MNAAVYLTTASWFLVLSVAAQQARIVVPPKSVNAGLNKTINFTCTAIASNIRWKVNKTFVGSDLRSRGFDDSSPILTLNVTQNLRTRTMVVSALSENNNTNITCFSFVSFVSIDESEAALLLVFFPGSQQVSNLAVILINSTTVLISWSPPFTLEGVPILGYNVTITNTTSGESETMLVEVTALLYSIDHPDPDENNFTVTVVPINEVGAGQPVNSEPFLFPIHVPESTVSITVESSQTIVYGTFISQTGTVPAETSEFTSQQQTSTTAQDHSIFDTMTTTMVPLIITTDSSAVVPALIIVNVVTVTSLMIAIVFIVWCVIKNQKIKRTATKLQALVEVPVKDNPAYQLISLQESHQESARTSMHVTTPPTHQASPQYENIVEVDEECGGDHENMKE